jgi:hypothetical protein
MMNRRTLALLLALAALALSPGCRRDQPAPAEEAPPPPDLPDSTITIPITIRLEGIIADLEKNVPRVLAEKKDVTASPPGVTYVVTRGAIDLTAEAGAIRIQLPVSLEAGAKVPGLEGLGVKSRTLDAIRGITGNDLGCKSSVEVAFRSALRIGDDWRLRAKTAPAGHRWKEPCRLSTLQLDVTQLIDSPLEKQLVTVAAMIDEKIAEAGDLREKVEEAWRNLSAPTPMGSGFWLVLNPASIAIGPLGGSGKALTTTAGIVARPEVVAGAQAPQPKPLPSNPGTVPPPGFRITLGAAIPFEEATRQARQELVGDEFEVSGQKVRVRDIRLSGAGGRFVVDADLEGAANAKVRLAGLPRYDQAKGELYAENLEFDLDTRNLIARAAVWLFESRIQQTIAEKARFPIGAHIEAARAQLAQSLNRQLNPQTTLKGTVRDLQLQGVYVTAQAYQAIVVAEGTLAMEIR